MWAITPLVARRPLVEQEQRALQMERPLYFQDSRAEVGTVQEGECRISRCVWDLGRTDGSGGVDESGIGFPIAICERPGSFG